MTEATTTTGDGSAPKPQGEGASENDIDWKAQSRKWEDRAKANKNAAEELEQLKQEQMTETQKAAAHSKALEAKVSQYETERQQNQWREKVSRDTGIPAHLLHGSTLEEMQDVASELDAFAHPKPKAPGVPGQGKTPGTPPAGQQSRAWINQLFGNK